MARPRTAAALRAVRGLRAAAAPDDRAAIIADAVFVAARDLLEAGNEPVEFLATVAIAIEVSASTVTKNAGLPQDPATIEQVKRYLLAGYRELTFNFDPEHFRTWVERQRAGPDGAGG